MSESTPGTEPTPDATPEPSAATPPASSGSTSAHEAVETFKAADRLDLGTIGAGVLVLLASFMPYYTMSYDLGAFGGEISDSVSAWHGFFGWFAVLCAVAAAGMLAAHLLGVALPVPVRRVVLALFGLALLCTVVAMFVYPGESCEDVLGAFGGEEVCKGFDEGRGFGYWLALPASIAGLALAAMRRSAD